MWANWVYEWFSEFNSFSFVQFSFNSAQEYKDTTIICRHYRLASSGIGWHGDAKMLAERGVRRWLVVVLWLGLGSTQQASRRRVFTPGVSGCEPIHLDLCRGSMPYSRTRMPNLLNHATQRNARLVLEQYQSLIDTRCGLMASHDYLLFYLCAVFAPICSSGFRLSEVSGRSRGVGNEGTIPPCRAVCETARTGCEPVMRQYNVSWPRELDCTRWPSQDRGICISPASISILSNNSVTGHYPHCFHHSQQIWILINHNWLTLINRN